MAMMGKTTWFERLTGVAETEADAVRAQFELGDGWLASRANGLRWRHGELSLPSLADLRGMHAVGRPGRLRVREVVADVAALHADPRNAGAVFQVASQFNLLEMVGPSVTPEQGIGRYELDRTQGPICAIAAGAGTVYRNYFVPVGGGVGQTAQRQIDCLADLGGALGNADGSLWRMQNGYALPTSVGLDRLAGRLQALGEDARDQLRGLLRIGVQRDTEVTLAGGGGHLVTQAYCSALPIAYSRLPAAAWEPFARLVLEAAYEATLRATLAGAGSTTPTCFLTLLGGGAFGNPTSWIVEAMARALAQHRDRDLDVAVVSYGSSQPLVRDLVARFTGGA